MDFNLLGNIEDIEIIATGNSINDHERLCEQYGKGKWRKLKGFTIVQLKDSTIHRAEVHWYEAHGIGKKEFKIKFPLMD